jgi:FAD dependent oxidoreductase
MVNVDERVRRAVPQVLDVMRVPVEGDASTAIVMPSTVAPSREVTVDVLIVGGGLGGVAAALAATRHCASVALLEETDWLGGQATCQGVSALDEHDYIERFGGSRSYYQFREAIRDYYRSLISGGTRPQTPFNPGSSWVSRVAFEPIVAVRVIDAFLAPAVEAGRLQIFRRHKAFAIDSVGERACSLDAIDLDNGSVLRISFGFVLDATELGDLLPLAGTDYVVGAESIAETGEPHAQPEQPRARCVQSCTYTFALERRPLDEDNRIARPTRYERYRDSQPYSLMIEVHGGEIYGEESGWLQYALFDTLPGTKGGLWTYRRLVAAANFPEHYVYDITMFNWPGMDYRDEPLVEQTPTALAKALQDAKQVSLGFLSWLQTAVQNGDGPGGIPWLRLRADVMGSIDGLSKHPYVREGRRIKALRTIVEQDVAVAFQPGARAAHVDDSIGIGWYPIDIHQAGEGDVGISTRTRPFQIPLAALIPRRVDNLLAANKNIGTTHITNGCYRLHPVEWNIGEAAGELAAMALEVGRTPKAIYEDQRSRRELQWRLLDDGVPVCWLIDVPVSDPDFAAIQRLVMTGGYGGGDERLTFEPDAMIDSGGRDSWLPSDGSSDSVDTCGDGAVTRRTFAATAAAEGRV